MTALGTLRAGPRKIVTSCICPPIPVREFDWCAFYEGDEESGQYGYGATEAEAIQDFKEYVQADRDAANKLRWAEVLMRAGEPELAAEIEVEGRIARRKFNDPFERNAA